MASRTLSVVARRRFRASRERIFEAFTNPKVLPLWFSPSEDIETDVFEMDLRQGGAYRLGFRFPDGQKNYVLGSFQKISRPARLVFTWTWEEPDRHAGIDTLVTVELIERGDETEIVVTHERFPDQETRDRHDEGWGGAFDRLAKLLDEAE